MPFAGVYVLMGVIWFFALGPLVGIVWIALGIVWATLAWRARDSKP